MKETECESEDCDVKIISPHGNKRFCGDKSWGCLRDRTLKRRREANKKYKEKPKKVLSRNRFQRAFTLYELEARDCGIF